MHPPPSFPMTIEEQLRLEQETQSPSSQIVGVEAGELQGELGASLEAAEDSLQGASPSGAHIPLLRHQHCPLNPSTLPIHEIKGERDERETRERRIAGMCLE